MERAAELREIERICRKAPMKPARSFHKALPGVWFIHVILQIESKGRFPVLRTLRYFSGTSCEIITECIECIRLGFGIPAFNNDAIIIEALNDRGVTLEDVRNCADLVVKQEVPDILCIAHGKYLKEGGAHCDISSHLLMGVANLSNSLAAFRKLVYDVAKLSRDALWNARMTDYAGEDGERIRRSTRFASCAWQAIPPSSM